MRAARSAAGGLQHRPPALAKNRTSSVVAGQQQGDTTSPNVLAVHDIQAWEAMTTGWGSGGQVLWPRWDTFTRSSRLGNIRRGRQNTASPQVYRKSR
jgi:hypothetical protein